MNFIIIILAISLSLDAFSLALSIGTIGYTIKKELMLSITVGIFHFFMPLLGVLFGKSFINNLYIDNNFLSGIIFLYIGIQMFKEFKAKSNYLEKMNFLNMIIFAFGVSLDSFGVGMTLTNVSNLLINVSVFSIVSFLFTFIGLILGQVLNEKIGDYAILIGTIIMIILATINFVNFCSFN